MSHKDDAGYYLHMAEENRGSNPELAAVYAAIGNGEATLALVEAQEAANEQAKVANSIALSAADLPHGVSDRAFTALKESVGTLGIEVAE